MLSPTFYKHFSKKIINIFFSTFFIFLQPPSSSHGSTRDGHGARHPTHRDGHATRHPTHRDGHAARRPTTCAPAAATPSAHWCAARSRGGNHGAPVHSGVGSGWAATMADAHGGRGARRRQLGDDRGWAPEEARRPAVRRAATGRVAAGGGEGR
jgi:hypothetical protein